MSAEQFGVTESQLTEIRQWATYERRLKSFKANCTLRTFNEIFGEAEGERLFVHYRSTCDYQFPKFLTYVTQEQKNKLLSYIVKYVND